MKKKSKYEVTSISYDRRNFYANKHEQLFEYDQARTLKQTYAESKGKYLFLPAEEFTELDVFVEGQLTLYKSQGETIKEYCYGGDFLSVNRCDCLIRKYENEFREIYVNDAVSFLHPGAYNIHHFFFEVLPVIFSNRDSLVGKKVLVPATTGGGKFFAEFKALLKLEMDFVEIPINSIVRGKHITVYGTFPFRIYPTECVNEIREHIWEELKSQDTKNIKKTVYIGRGDMERDRRRILNESSALAAMDDMGLDYSVIRPGLEPLEKTIRTLMNANAIIGPTGGAMFHQVWAKNLRLLLELKPEQYQSMSESEELARIFGYEYRESPTTPDSLGFWSNSDQVIDLFEFNQRVKFLKSQI
jgi:hypothetical protein